MININEINDMSKEKHVDIHIIHSEERETALKLIWAVFQQYEAPDYPPQGLRTFYDSVIVNDQYQNNLKMYGAYADNELLGVIATRSAGTHIALFFVDGNYHRRGIGRQLFEAVKADCSQDRITVNASPYAVDIYHHLGFKDLQPEQMTDGMRYTPMQYDSSKL